MALRTSMANIIKQMTAQNNVRTITTTTKQRQTSLKEELLPKGKSLRDYVPVYVALGMVSLALSLGLYTAKQELLHAPDVRVKKTRRETLPEVVEPDYVAHQAEEFISKSLFRRLAHIYSRVRNSNT